MPTTRHRRIRGHVKDLNGDKLEHHILGYRMLDRRLPVFASEEECFESWEENRTHILGLMGQECRGESFMFQKGSIYFPFYTRPASWYRFESPGPRLLLSGDPENALPEYGSLKGIPLRYKSFEAWKKMVFESEPDYLKRLNILNEAEKKILAIDPQKSIEVYDAARDCCSWFGK